MASIFCTNFNNFAQKGKNIVDSKVRKDETKKKKSKSGKCLVNEKRKGKTD